MIEAVIIGFVVGLVVGKVVGYDWPEVLTFAGLITVATAFIWLVH